MRPPLRDVKLHQQAGDGAFAGAAGAHEGNFLARRDVEVDVLEHRDIGPGGVAEGHVLVLNVAPQAGRHQPHGRLNVGGLGRFIQDFEDALGGTEGALHLAVDFAQARHRGPDEGRVDDEGREVADLEVVGVGDGRVHQRGPAPQHQDDAAKQADNHKRHEAAAVQVALQGRPHHLAQRGVVAAGFEPLVGEGFHRVDGLQGFLHDGVGVGQLLLHGARQGANFAPKQPGRQHDGREGDEHKQRQFPRHDHDEADAAEQRKHLPEQLGQRQRKRVLNLGHVAGNARGNSAHAVFSRKTEWAAARTWRRAPAGCRAP